MGALSRTLLVGATGEIKPPDRFGLTCFNGVATSTVALAAGAEAAPVQPTLVLESVFERRGGYRFALVRFGRLLRLTQNGLPHRSEPRTT
jgi:hypothetical protein